MSILISPWSAVTQEGKPSPKNYPHWGDVVRGLRDHGYDCIQVSRAGEPEVPFCKDRKDDLKLGALAYLLVDCETWISVDNFFHHMAWTLGQPGVVLFGQSDPVIFGHQENINLLKSRRYLRQYQFQFWHQVDPNPEAWVHPDQVVVTALLSIERRRPK